MRQVHLSRLSDVAPNPKEVSLDMIAAGGAAFRVPLAPFDATRLVGFLKQVQKITKECAKTPDACATPDADAVRTSLLCASLLMRSCSVRHVYLCRLPHCIVAVLESFKVAFNCARISRFSPLCFSSCMSGGT